MDLPQNIESAKRWMRYVKDVFVFLDFKDRQEQDIALLEEALSFLPRSANIGREIHLNETGVVSRQRLINFRCMVSWALDHLKFAVEKGLPQAEVDTRIRTLQTVIESLCNGRTLEGHLTQVGTQEACDVNDLTYDPEWRWFRRRLDRTIISQEVARTLNFSEQSWEQNIDEERLSTQKSKWRKDNENKLYTKFVSRFAPMTAVVVRRDGFFVRGGQNEFVQVMDDAFVQEKDSGVNVPCRMVINPTYRPAETFSPRPAPELVYVGFEYPDKTSLSYVPIKFVNIVYPPLPGRTHDGANRFVHADISKEVLRALKSRAKAAYVQTNPHAEFFDHPENDVENKKVRIEVLVRPGRVVSVEDGDRCIRRPLLEVLEFCEKDVSGSAMMHMRFTSTRLGSAQMQLRFLFFELRVSRVAENQHEKIFELLKATKNGVS